MFQLSLSQLPILLGLLSLLAVLVLKRKSVTTRDLFAGVLLAVLVFVVLSGLLTQVHVPEMTVHLFDGK